MDNMISFVRKHGQKSFESFPFCEIDSLILCQISYYNFYYTPLREGNGEKTLAECLRGDNVKLLRGLMTIRNDRKLIKAVLQSKRYAQIGVCSYEEKLDAASCRQFAAITFDLGKDGYYIAFRGTDNSVTGWKEDMYLSFRQEIPSQQDAVRYLLEQMRRRKGSFRLGGHSKGGNLAIYAAMQLSAKELSRVRGIHSYDGPGLYEGLYRTAAYRRVRPLIHKTIPQSSVFGLLWEKDRRYRIVKSCAAALVQHDPYTWLVFYNGFVPAGSLSRFARYMNRTLNTWLDTLDMWQRRQLVDAVFDSISCTGIHMFLDLTEDRNKKLAILLKSLADMEMWKKRMLARALAGLLWAAARELGLGVLTFKRRRSR